MTVKTHPMDVRRRPAYIMKFGNVTYKRRLEWFTRKIPAQQFAAEMRKEGRRARILNFNHRWFVYTTDKLKPVGYHPLYKVR